MAQFHALASAMLLKGGRFWRETVQVETMSFPDKLIFTEKVTFVLAVGFVQRFTTQG